jgi:DNA-directed RNA polymerase II subunit RPB1
MGDEMNCHLAQSIQARNELERIANVKYQIISAKDSNPIIGCVQDSLSGAYIMSMDDDIDYGMACNLLCNTSSPTKSQLKKGEKVNGKQLFSHIIPEGINSVKKKGKDIIFQIKNGKLLEGQLDKSQLSTTKNSIIHYVWDKYGPTPTQKFIDDTQRLILNYLLDKGFTVGIKNCIIPIELVRQLREIIHTKIISANHSLTQYENDYDKIIPETGDGILSMELNAVSSNIGKLIMDVLEKDNGLNVMISSKSKGSVVNMTQMAGCLGQVLVESQRIKKRVSGRTLSLFHQNDDTPAARGFIGSSFLDGLKAYEFFFHTMGGREGLIDTAIRTAETGYIQRKCVKFLEDLMVNYEGLIRTANGTLVQYLFGDSGIDQQKQTQVKLNIINLNNNAIKEQFTFSDDEIKQLEKKYKIDCNKFNKLMYEKMISMRDKLREIYFLSTGNYKVIDDSFMLPINLLRISQEIASEEAMSVDPNYIVEKIEDLLTNYDDRFITMMKKNSKLLKEDDQAYKFMLRTGLYEYIAPRKCLFEYKISKTGFDNLIEDIRILLSRALVEPGEMVGVVAAQSIGEPTSQLTMNTKHAAGKAGVSGVSRIKEIMSFSKNIKSPQMTIYFDDKYGGSKSDTNLIASYLKHLTIRELISSAEILYSMDNKDSLSKMLENDNVTNPFFINNTKDNIKSLPFVIRLTMNLEKMMEKETTLLDIKTKFVTYWYKNFSNIKNVKKSHKDILINVDKLAVLSNNDNIIHIRFILNDFNYNLLTNFLNIILDVITLKGIDHIDNVHQNQERRITFNEEGDTLVDKEYVAITEGINLEGIKMLKGINHTRTKINDINIIYINYGIEAARNAIIYELLTTYEANGAGINHAHMSLLVDTMTYSGEVISIDRHGMNKVDNDPISKASFEKTMEHFINAAIFCETDKMTSVSSRVALGRVIGGGTGSFDLILDTDKLKNSEYIENETGGRTNFIPLTIEPLFGDIIKNGFARNDFFIPN